ncbi:MAG: dsDNA nuclease domain-containing protein [Pseudomonadota bacterium]
MTNNQFTELLDVTNRDDLAEVGGGHNQKGVEFQRHWAVMRMFELEKAGEKDFLFLFEAIQDVAILDSCISPTTICVYQIKKKDRKEWAWAELTSLHQPKDPSKTASGRKTKAKPLTEIKNSPIGKLYSTILAFKKLKSTGRFVSNAGFDLLLADGSNAATSLPSALSELSTHHLDLLSKGLETLHKTGASVPDLSCIHLERVFLPVDDPGTYIIGLVHKFLEDRSPRHAGQARSLVESLLAKIGPLGSKTATCKTFDDLRAQRGYSRSDFTNALGMLESTPDLSNHLETWLNRLAQEGVGFIEITAIRIAATAIFRRQVMGTRSKDEENLVLACDAWLANHPDPIQLKPFFQAAHDDLQSVYPSIKKLELFAYLALRAIKKCVDQT